MAKKFSNCRWLSCTACHAVDGVRGAVTSVKGPNLSAVAAGLPVDLLVESVLWARAANQGRLRGHYGDYKGRPRA